MNDLQAIINAMNSASRDTRSDYHLTLGGLITALTDANPGAPVKFDGGGEPSDPHSYRGYYSDLAFEKGGAGVTAAAFLDLAKSCLGREFTGYKGGEFSMDADTPLWASAYGTTGAAIVGIRVHDDAITLITKDIDLHPPLRNE